MVSKLAHRAGIVALGTAGGQGAILLATPWLARQYSPADFGALALMTTVSNTAMAVACLRYDLALPSAKDAESSGLLRVACVATLFTSCSFVLVNAAYLLLAQGNAAAPFSLPLLGGLCVLAVGLHQAALGVATQQQAFAGLAFARFGQGVGFTLAALLTPLGLLWSHALSFLAALPLLRRLLSRRKQADEVSVRAVAYKHREFPLASLPGALLDVIGYSLCVWIVTRAYGAAAAGQYSQIQRLVGAPLMLMAISLGQVMLRHTADLAHDGLALRQLVKNVFKVLALVAAVGLFMLAMVGETVLGWMLGAQWRVDAAFVLPIALAVAIRACVSPLTTLLVTLRRFDLALRWQATYFLSALTVFRWASAKLPIDKFVLVYAAHEMIFYITYLLLVKAAIPKTCAASSD